MQHEIKALLKALLAEQERERQFYHTLLATVSISANARKRMLEDIVGASKAALGADDDLNNTSANAAQDHLTEAIKRMAEARRYALAEHQLN